LYGRSCEIDSTAVGLHYSFRSIPSMGLPSPLRQPAACRETPRSARSSRRRSRFREGFTIAPCILCIS
jgi:hypothetical protein